MKKLPLADCSKCKTGLFQESLIAMLENLLVHTVETNFLVNSVLCRE